MNKIQIAPWGRIVPRFERAGGPVVGVLYHMSDGRLFISEARSGSYALQLNGRERIFPDRTSMTRWVKAHLV